MLHQRCVRAFDQEGQCPTGFLSGGEANRFGGRDPGVARADYLDPAADHRRLDEAEALKGETADRSDHVPSLADAVLARSFGGIVSLRHLMRVMP